MAETQTLSQLPRLAAISRKALMMVEEPGAVTGAVEVRKLLGRLISTDEATATSAELAALLNYDENAIALVFADPDVKKNGWYRKAGAVGAGSWSQFERLTIAVDDLIAEANRQAVAAMAAAEEARLTVLNPRPATLADASLTHFTMVKGGSYFNSGTNLQGAIKFGLPAGVDAREVTMRLLVRDHYGSLVFHIGGRNDSQWNYQTVRVEGQHRILAEHPVRFGNDGTRDCVWIGNTSYAFWDNLTAKVLEATFDGEVITEAWAGSWSVDLTTAIENVYVGPIATYLDVSSQYIRVDAARLAVAIGPGANTGFRTSNYQILIGGLVGAGSPDDFNNVGVGLQCFSQSNGSSATTLIGLQAGQNVKQVMNGTGVAIHALLSWETGQNMTAVGAGSQQYGKHFSRSTSLGAYAGRDNQSDDCLFLGNNAGLYSTDEAGAFHVAKHEHESLLRGNFNDRYLNVNGALSSEGVMPLADNVHSLGTSARRYSVVYAGTGAINTSDERTKRSISPIPDEWLDAWGTVEWVRYKFVDGHRWHTGLVAQRVHDAFAAVGIDAFEIGLCCIDRWDEQTEAVTELRSVDMVKQRPKVEDGEIVYVDKKVGITEDGGDFISHVPVMEDYTDTVEQLFRTGEVRVVRAAGELWGLRYDECFAMEAAYQRREIARLAAMVTGA